MWKYIKPCLHFMAFAALGMMCEVSVDLLQPYLMSRIVDEGVLGTANGGVSDMRLILTLGLCMLGLVFLGGLGGSLCSVFASMACENAGNCIRKDCFDRIMFFSFPQVDRFGTGALITRITNDVTQVQLDGIRKVEHDAPWSPESQYLGVPVGEASPEQLAAATPPATRASGCAPCWCSTAPPTGMGQQSVEFVEALKAKGLADRVRFVPIEDAGHEDKKFTAEENMALVFSFLEKALSE